MKRRGLEQLGEESAKQRRQLGQHKAKCREVFNVWHADMFFQLHPCNRGSFYYCKCRQVEVLFNISSE